MKWFISFADLITCTATRQHREKLRSLSQMEKGKGGKEKAWVVFSFGIYNM